jgi:hypothetical protein
MIVMLRGITIRELGKNLTIPPLVQTSKDIIDVIDFKNINFGEYDFIAQNGMAGPGKKHLHIYEFTENLCKNKKIPLLIRELPVIRNEKTSNWWRFSWNHYFLDEGIYPYDESCNRWEELKKKLNIEVKEWNRPGDLILICLQKPMDSALNRLHEKNIKYQDFCIDLIKNIKKISDRKILIRPHPKDPTDLIINLKFLFSDIELSCADSIYDDLNRSFCMITYNSTSSVESVIYGIPTITLDTSAVSKDVTFHSINNIESEIIFDRDKWLKEIAFMQWSEKEILSGYVWNLLKNKIWIN